MDKAKQILHHIKMDPFISQQVLSNRVGLSRPAVANYIADLMKSGEIRGRAYILKEVSSIVCIGGMNIDRKAKAKQDVSLYTSNPVKTKTTCGGVARNFAENLSHLGYDTILMACIGNDKEGGRLLAETKNSGVDVSQVWMFPEGSTGTFTTLLDVSGNSIVSMADMNIYENLTVSMVEKKWATISSADAIFLDMNLPLDSIHYIVKRCNEENIQMYIDPVSPAKSLKLPACLEGVTLLMLTQEEMEELSGTQINAMKDCEAACEILQQRGAEGVIVMLSDKSVYYFSEEERGHLPPFCFKTAVVDFTGESDALAACVVYGVMNGESLQRSCQLGLAGIVLTLQTEASISTFLNPERIYEIVQELSE